jgi:LuxR family maltose regulon positive regulatory protein
VLVLDDYHAIDTDKIHKIIELLLDYLPAHIHLVITTRVDPPLPLARLRVGNQLTELRAADLCFTVDETTQFFNRIMNLKLSGHDISVLESRTEGWIAGLQLAGLSMQGREDIPSFIKTFAGDDRHVVDYLAEEVLNVQSEQIQNFLLQTSILNRLSAPLCDFVTHNKGSQEILNELERANLFIVPLDNKRYWYRYHHLFAELLQQRLHQTQSDLVAELHNRASKWCRQNGLEDEAVNHALATQDFEQVALLIVEQADAIWERGEHAKFRHWLEKLPADLVFSKPQLSILQAESLLIHWRLDAAEQSLQVAEQALNQSTEYATEISSIEQAQLSNLDRMRLLGRIAANRALIASFREDVPAIIQHGMQALEFLPEQELTWRSTVAITLGDGHSIKGDLMSAHKAQVEALEACKVSGNDFLLLIANANLVVTLRQQGWLQRTLEICQQQVQLASEGGMSQTVVVGWLLAIWGEVLAELNDFDGAIDKARAGVELTERCGDVGMLCKSYLCLMRVFYSMGNMADTEEILLKLENISRQSDITIKIASMIAAWQARIWLAQGKLEAASQWVVKRGLEVEGELQFAHEDETMVLARILIAQGRLDEAVGLLDRLIKEGEAGDRITSLVEMLLIQALALKAQGDANKAMTTLGKALSIAEPGGFIRIFIDEGPLMAELLEKVLDAKIDVPQAYVKKLLTNFRLNKLIKTDDGLVERLSERELEVLRFIAAGLSNKAIMKELFISISTVKTHLSHIYSKLNVNSRTQATLKAKELDLL